MQTALLNIQSFENRKKDLGLLMNMNFTLKSMPPILLCWLSVSETDIVDTGVEVEPSCQYSAKFCCQAADVRVFCLFIFK